METMYFVIGIVSAVFTFIVGYSAVGVFKLNKKMEDTFQAVDSLNREDERIESDIHTRISDEIRFMEEKMDSAIRGNTSEMISQIDSRLDKLENRITSKIPPTNDEVMLELKKVREDFLTLRSSL